MAEIAIFVTNEQRPDDHYQDGDVLHAFNDRQIGWVHAWHILDPRKGQTNFHGLRVKGGPAFYHCEATREWRFERLGATTVLRTNLWTTAQDVVEMPNLQLFLNRRTARADHIIFGTPGAECWHGGGTDMSATKVDELWAWLEGNTNKRRAAHRKWMWSDKALSKYLILPVLDMRDEIVRRAEGVEMDYDSLQPEYDPELGIGTNIVRKRRASVNWRAMPGINPVQVLNTGVKLEYRNILEPQGTTYVQVKPRKNFWSVRDHLRPNDDQEFFV